MMHNQKQIGRRTFLKTSSMVIGGAALTLPHVIPSRVLGAPGRAGANERLTLAHIGVGGMGTYHLNEMVSRMKRGEVDIAAVCDADQARLEKAGKAAGQQADLYRDYRHVLQRNAPSN